MDKSTHQVRCEQWTQIISQCLESGMSKKDWCNANGISEKAFYYWQRILRNEAYIEYKQLPIAKESASKTPVAFVELKSIDTTEAKRPAFHPDVIIRSKGMVLEISNTASPELLVQLGALFHA